MYASRRLRQLLSLTLVLLGFATGAAAQVPLPAPDPSGPPNIFYGAIPPDPPYPPKSTVLVFLHGLHGRAADWWTNNDVYSMAYQAGYRTAYISINADNSPNEGNITDNALALQSLVPQIAAHYGVARWC